MDHDRNFKELLSNFFTEFVELFLPDIAADLEPDTEIVPLDKELIPDAALGGVHEVDLLMKVKFKGEDAYFLVHVENQATPQADFPKRMFRYFAYLTLHYDLPVYPVVIFSYDTPLRPEPKSYTVAFRGRNVLQFTYRVIQLNRLSWRSFVYRKNPVAIALSAKMKMRPGDRPKARAEGFRNLATLNMDAAKSRIIGAFVESYLTLTAEQTKRYETMIAAFAPPEREATMGLVNSWEQRGIEQGISQGIEQGISQGIEQGISQGIEQGISQGVMQGKEELVLRQIRRRFTVVPEDVAARLERLTSDQLNELGEALFDFTNSADLEQWLAHHSA